MSALKMAVVNEAEQQNLQEIEQLKAKLKELKSKTKSVSFKLKPFVHSKTGVAMVGIEVHGITPRPIFLYGSQALKMVEVANNLREFVEANRKDLSWKE
jgi:ribosomal protein S15P/S13E